VRVVVVPLDHRDTLSYRYLERPCSPELGDGRVEGYFPFAVFGFPNGWRFSFSALPHRRIIFQMLPSFP
jgi:hypothetical protein